MKKVVSIWRLLISQLKQEKNRISDDRVEVDLARRLPEMALRLCKY